MGARHATEAAQIQARAISIHTPRMGARLAALICSACSARFQSTRPAWGRDVAALGRIIGFDISIHTPRMGARHIFLEEFDLSITFQSTRPAWGRDSCRTTSASTSINFNPHAPHGGATIPPQIRFVQPQFQSTRPAWGRDLRTRSAYLPQRHFNPHAPHGGATLHPLLAMMMICISIHTPRMGARQTPDVRLKERELFQSTRPAWGRD